MRTALAGAALAAAALSGTLSGTASAGCATDYLITAGGPPPKYYTITTEPSVTLHPERLVENVESFLARTATFVECAS